MCDKFPITILQLRIKGWCSARPAETDTAATEGEWRLCIHPCLLVCGYLKRLWTDSAEIWWTGCMFDVDKMIRFWWRSGSGSWYENCIHHWEMAPKTTYSMIFQKVEDELWQTWLISWVGDNNKPIRFCLTSGCRSGLSVDAKRKLFSLMEVCALPSAVLIWHL